MGDLILEQTSHTYLSDIKADCVDQFLDFLSPTNYDYIEIFE